MSRQNDYLGIMTQCYLGIIANDNTHSKESYGNKYFIRYDDYNDGIIPLYIRLPPVKVLAKYFKYSKHMNRLVYDKELLKDIMQYGIKLIVYSKKNLIVNHCIRINT